MRLTASALKLFLLVLRPYSIPYLALLSSSGLIIARADLVGNLGVVAAGLFFWMGGMLYYDLSHHKQDRVSRPKRLLSAYPAIEG